MVARVKILGILSLLCIVTACNGREGDDRKEVLHTKVDENFLSTVRTAKVSTSNPQEELILTGMVEADPDKETSYVPLISGVIDKVYFTLGDKVKKGQVMVDIRSTELNALQPELLSLESEMKVAERELKTAQDLFEDTMIPEKELLEAQSRLKQAQAAYSRVQTDMSVLGTARGNGAFSIKAPLTGYVTSKRASSGSTILSDGEPLFTIVDLSSVWVTVNVYASDLTFVRDGMEAEITTLSYSGETFSGKISKLSQVFDPEDKTLKAKIILPNSDLKFKPGMSVVVKLKNEAPYSLVSVPSSALIFDSDRYFVIVQKTPGEFELRSVTIRGHSNNVTYVLSGLSEEETIVVKNQLLIYSQLAMDD